MRVDCGATHKHLPTENYCREPVSHRGQHVAPDSQGRPEYVWTDGDVWDWAPAAAPPSPDPGEVERVARALWGVVAARVPLLDSVSWDSPGNTSRDLYRDLARAALDAARPATDAEQKVARVERVLDDVRAERKRQDEKWGEQNHPDVDQVLMTRPGGCTPQRMAEEYEIPNAGRAKVRTDLSAHDGRVTWAHIAVEELAEAVEAAVLGDEDDVRTEVVQLAAVCVQWVQAIDRRRGTR